MSLHGMLRSLREAYNAGDEESSTQVAQALSVDVSFEDILMTVIFLMASWMMAMASQFIGLPSLVGEIMTGFILGPPLLNLVPYPEAMVLIGSFGLIGLLLDSGINLDIARLRETGSRAVLMAVTGTLLALGAGVAMGYAGSEAVFRSSFAVGAAFAPSSFGVASQVLAQGEVLNTPMGQVIVAASVVDDILGLILLSVMEVLVKESPRVMDYVIPFVSSFGYLIVLGYLGITVVPRLVEHYIQPRFPSETRDFVAFSMLWILVALYLPLMSYSRASYLTGAFLAGLSFSQLRSVHKQYTRAGPHLKIWLMRIFFAANIGFQVPIKYFTNGNVLNWGFLYFIPVLAKLPLGLLVPRLSRDLPNDFPYDPYWRDCIVTTLAFTCRAEFNFIIASFALSSGVFDPEQYAAVVFAILLSAIVAPLALSKVIDYYNDKLKTFLEGKHKIDRIENTRDGTRPLFLAIQARTPVSWGLQGKFERALESVGLLIVDHRSWHTLGLDAVNITEILCQDKVSSVRIRGAFLRNKSLNDLATTGAYNKQLLDSPEGNRTVATIKESPTKESLADLEDIEEEEELRSEEAEIELRKQIVRDALVDCLGADVDESSYTIVVSKWETVVFDMSSGSEKDGEEELDRTQHAGFRLATRAPSVKDSSQINEDKMQRPEDVIGFPDLEAPVTTSVDGDHRLTVESRLFVPNQRNHRRARSEYSDIARSLTSGDHRLTVESRTIVPNQRNHRRARTEYSDIARNLTSDDLHLDGDTGDSAQEYIGQGYFVAPIDVGFEHEAEASSPSHRSPRRVNTVDTVILGEENEDVT